ESTTEIGLAANARFVAWETISLGRPAFGDLYRSGRLDQRTRIAVDGRPILIERTIFEAGDAVLDRDWGFGRRTVLGTLYAYPADARALDAARERLGALPALPAGARAVDAVRAARPPD